MNFVCWEVLPYNPDLNISSKQNITVKLEVTIIFKVPKAAIHIHL